MLACYHDDFVLHYSGNNPFTGDHVGKEAAIATLLAVNARAPRELVAIDEILAGPDSAVITARERLTIDGTPHELRRVLRYHITDGTSPSAGSTTKTKTKPSSTRHGHPRSSTNDEGVHRYARRSHQQLDPDRVDQWERHVHDR